MAAGGAVQPEVVIEAGDAIDLGARDVEGVRQHQHGRLGNEAELRLHRVQRRQQAAGDRDVRVRDRAGAVFVPGNGRSSGHGGIV